MDISINVPKTGEINISGNRKEITVPDKSVTYAKLADDVTLILSEKADKASTDSALEQKADKTSVDAEILEVNVALERIKYYGSADVVPSDESWFTVNDTGETITGLTDYCRELDPKDIVIPYKIAEVIITGIGSDVFSAIGAKTIRLPNSITNIGEWAFSSCDGLTAINIPNGVTSIAEGLFAGCSSLGSINLPDGVTNIGGLAFIETALSNVEIPESVTVIGERAFESCPISSIVIPKSVTSISNDTFDSCTSFTIYCEQGSYADEYAKENNIPVVYTDVKDIATETELARLKYYGDKDIVPSLESYFTVNSTGETITGLTDTGKAQAELVIPYRINGKLITALDSGYSVTSILHPAGNVQTKVVIPNSVKIIGGYAFFNCSTLVSVNIPNSVTSIGDYAFCACTSLKIMSIPNSVEAIDDYAFNACSSLKIIDLPNSVTSIADGVFGGCTNLTIYCEQGSTADTYARHNGIPIIYTGILNEPTFHSMLVETDINFINGNRVGMNGVYMVDYEVTAVDTSIPKEHHLTHKADTADVLTKTNTTEFTPTADYQPATKKYVDEAISTYDTEAMALLGGDAE